MISVSILAPFVNNIAVPSKSSQNANKSHIGAYRYAGRIHQAGARPKGEHDDTRQDTPSVQCAWVPLSHD